MDNIEKNIEKYWCKAFRVKHLTNIQFGWVLYRDANLTEEFIMKNIHRIENWINLASNKKFNIENCSNKFKFLFGKYFK